MGASILASLVDVAVSKVIAFVSDQFNLVLGWDKDLTKFRDTMEMLRGFLQDANEKNVSDDHALKSWLQGLRDIADEADDILEEVAYEGMQRKNKKSKVRHLTLPDPSTLRFRRVMADRVADLNKRLADINSSAQQLRLQKKLANMVPEPRGRAIPETHSFLSSQVFGRDEDVSKIVRSLVDSSSQHDLPVMIIVGMAGLGKTTIAKAVLKNDKIREHFGDNKMWVCVSENFDVKMILMEMLKSCGGSSSGDGDFGSKDIVMKKIQEKLREKNYLLILDDVWNEERQKWEDLRDCLLGISGSKGSRGKVLVTTRLEDVASVMALTDEHIHRPRLLKEDECWTIIKQRAFGDNSVPEGLEGIGKQIARRCKGVPLVANITGAILQNKRDKREWQAITENCVWDSLEKQEGILDIVKFSYDRLPTLALRQCFAFCSIFPKDFVMEREMLIQLWMAQGFLESPEEISNMEAEDIGDKYFRYLLSYSLFQDEIRDDVTGSVEFCKMHDLIHDFAQSISKSETLIVEERPRSNISHDVRHLNLIDGRDMVPSILGDVAEKLQTLFSKHSFSNGVQVDLIRLRVLSLRGVYDAKQLPTCFGNLKRLRYLDISRTQIKELPEFISELYNLQTFRFTECRSLKMPPGGIGDLINLKHIDFSDEERMPANLGRLTNLQTLPLFFVGTTEGRKIEELGSLRELKGRLKICKLELVASKSEAEGAKFKDKAVGHLIFHWSEGKGNQDKDEDVLEGLQPPSNIRRLRIAGYGGRKLASWMLSLNNLVDLTISRCYMLHRIPDISGLLSLQQLHVRQCDEVTSLGDGDGAFTSLKQLSINGCGKLERVLVSGLSSLEELKIVYGWVINSIGDSLSSSTCLKHLHLEGCLKLQSIPSLEGLVSLKTIYISRCDELERLPSGLSSCTALEKLNIEGCSNLVSILEELKQLQSLVELKFWSCPKLKFIRLEGLVSLKTVYIYQCDELECLPSGLSSCTALKKLKINECSSLVSIPEEVKQLQSLVELDFEKCPKLKFIPSLEGLVSLKTINIYFCEELERLPSGLSSCTALEKLEITGCSNLVSIPEELKQLQPLVELKFWSCPKLKFIPSLEGLVSLKKINIFNCKELERLPSGLSSCTALEKLVITECSNLVSIPEELKQLQSLVELDFENCPKLKFIPRLEGLVSLKTVIITGCHELEHLPSGLPSCTALEKLEIWGCSNLVSIPEELKQLQSLVELNIKKCQNLRSFPEEILGSLASLKELGLGPFSEELKEFPDLSSTSSLEVLRLEGWGESLTLPHQIDRLTALRNLTITSVNGVEEALLENLSCLKTLEIQNCCRLRCLSGGLSSLEDLVITNCPKFVGFPEESLGCFTRLKGLEIGRFSEELEEFPSLSSIPASLEYLSLTGWEKLTHLPQIQHLTALKQLCIEHFSGMESLRDWFNNLSSLQELKIWGCPNELKERCTEGSGPDWHKISHIPDIEIDGIPIQYEDGYESED
ncbi:hypothetical protein SLEP1_g38227 [Rubroshorea leprosula]|uniref:Disease resistance protein RGA3 n=1 Tax=Rubroshorea leprosula TaxID=152421 RepID=A0AAV5KX66_9ROSI|nr:hypothetical protein SLEP1_g38227 [Rubroshorea leprosula]